MNENIKLAKKLIKLAEDLMDFIPVESGLSDDNIKQDLSFGNIYYFGDCKNTVDIDQMWNATQMSQVIQESIIVPTQNIIHNIKNGDRNIPAKLINYIHSKKNDLSKKQNIICGYNKQQYIVFIYISKFDTHFFFDVNR